MYVNFYNACINFNCGKNNKAYNETINEISINQLMYRELRLREDFFFAYCNLSTLTNELKSVSPENWCVLSPEFDFTGRLRYSTNIYNNRFEDFSL